MSMDRASYNMAIIQQDAAEYSLFRTVNCWVCFGWYTIFHPSSGARVTLSASSGINETVTCRERGWTGTAYLINARYCRYSVMSSWWWVNYHPKHVEQLKVLNKLYSVASCWIIIATLAETWLFLRCYLSFGGAFIHVDCLDSCWTDNPEDAVCSVPSKRRWLFTSRRGITP